MGGIGWKEILFIGLIVMLFFGAKRLPELARSLRKSVDEFKKGSDDDDSSAVTFWGKRDLRQVLRKALEQLDQYYSAENELDPPR